MSETLTAKQKVLKLIKEYVLNTSVSKLLTSYAVKAAGITSGFGAWLVGLVMKKLLEYGIQKHKEAEIKEEVKLENDKDDLKYEEVLQNPNSTNDDIANAAPDFLGGTVNKPK